MVRLATYALAAVTCYVVLSQVVVPASFALLELGTPRGENKPSLSRASIRAAPIPKEVEHQKSLEESRGRTRFSSFVERLKTSPDTSLDFSSMEELLQSYGSWHTARLLKLAQTRDKNDDVTPDEFRVFWVGPSQFGFGNRILSIVSCFFFAMLNQAVFLIEWRTPLPLSRYFEPKLFDWENADLIKYIPSLEADWLDRGIVVKEPKDWVRDGQQSRKGYYVGMKNMFPDIVENGDAAVKKLGLGIDAQRTFSSMQKLWKGLLQPSDMMKSRLSPYVDTIRGKYSIGLQVRMNALPGDTLPPPSNDRLDGSIYRCATMLAERSGHSSSDVCFIIVSDNTDVRQKLSEQARSEGFCVVNQQNVRLQHSGEAYMHRVDRSEGWETGVDDAMIDWFLLGLSDDIVLSGTSTFGMTAAMRRTSSNVPYIVEMYPDPHTNFEDSCQIASMGSILNPGYETQALSELLKTSSPFLVPV